VLLTNVIVTLTNGVSYETNGYEEMCDTNKNVTQMGVIIKWFTEVCFEMTEWAPCQEGSWFGDINHHEHGFQWTLPDFHHRDGKTHHCR